MATDQDQTLTLLSLSFPCQRSSPSSPPQTAPTSSPSSSSSSSFLHLTPPLPHPPESSFSSNQESISLHPRNSPLSSQLFNQSESLITPPVFNQESSVPIHTGTASRARKNPYQGPRPGKKLTVQPPYHWATDKRAMVHSLEHLLGEGIRTVSGEVKCQKCEARLVISYDIKEKFEEIKSFLTTNHVKMYSRAPDAWLHPRMPACSACSQTGYLRPVMADKKRDVNWLFLFLGQMLGFCNLKQLKYFCKHNGNHRTGGKPWVLYKAYVIMSTQLDPSVSLL